MAEFGDKVCRWDAAQRSPIFGRAVPVHEEPEENENEIPEGNADLLIQWEGNDVLRPLAEFPHFVYDRCFREGEKVLRADGTRGEVVRVTQFITLYIHGSEFVIRDVPIERLRPLLDFFPGVQLHCNGWLGELVEVQRRIGLEYEDSTRFYVSEDKLQIPDAIPEPINLRNSTEIRLNIEPDLDPNLIRAYPYTQNCRLPYIGNAMTFKWNELQQFNWEVKPRVLGFLNRPYWLGLRYKNRPARVTSIDVDMINVEWRERLGCNSPAEEPNTVWPRTSMGNLQLLPVPQELYFFPNSLMVLELVTEDVDSISHVRDWEKNFCEDGFGTGGVPRAKIPRLALPFEPKQSVPVRGLLLRNKVTVDAGDGNIWTGMASELRRDPMEEFIPIDPSNLVVIKKRYLDPISGKFGINRGPNRENEGFLDIKWYQVLAGDPQAVMELSNDTEQEPFLDLDFPEAFNQFLPGVLVSKTPASVKNFNYGKVHQVHRDGKVSILLPRATVALEVWPFEIEKCGTANCGPVFTPVEHPQAISGLLKTLEEQYGHLPEQTDKWECLKEMPEGNFFANEPNHKVVNDPSFFRVLLGEIVILGRTLPENVWVKSFEDKINTMSILMLGPRGTLYEDCLFVFEMYLPEMYPIRCPKVHFVNMTSACLSEDLKKTDTDLLNVEDLISRLPANLHSEPLSRVTGAPNSFSIATIVTAIRHGIFIQDPSMRLPRVEEAALVLAARKRTYNQEVLIGILDSVYGLLTKPPEPWTLSIQRHLAQKLPRMIARWRNWTGNSTRSIYTHIDDPEPEFPLLPLTHRAQISIDRRLAVFSDLN